MYETVIAPLDGSQLAGNALPHALALARCFGATLLLLRVVEPPDESAAEATVDPTRAETSDDVLQRRDFDARRSQAEGYLQGLQRSLAGEGIQVETGVKVGRPGRVLTELAATLPRPLLVITPFGKTASLSPARSGVFGSVADELLRAGVAPVLVVRPG